MDILATPNRKYLWMHLMVIGSIIFGQLIIPDFVGAWYIMIPRPQFVAAGALPCDSRPALSPEYVPKNCDLMLETITGTTKQQQYADSDGRENTTVIWDGGHWSRTDTSRPAVTLSLVFPALAFVFLLVGLVGGGRLRQVAYIYSLPIIATGILVALVRG